jgi:hypothetical protein
MGCDIHGYIEYDQSGPDYKFTFNFAKVKLARNYWMFTLLASVRGDNIQGIMGREPKGVPPDMSSTLRDDYYLQLTDDDNPLIDEGIGYIGRAEAKRRKYKVVCGHHCENVDHHSISYMNLDELDAVLADYMKCSETLHVVLPAGELLRTYDNLVRDNDGTRLVERTQPVSMPADFAAVRAAMKAMRDNGVEARFVYFFDN